MGDEILKTIFLVMVFLVISGIMYNELPGYMMMPTFAVMAICLWISLDYMLCLGKDKMYKVKPKDKMYQMEPVEIKDLESQNVKPELPKDDIELPDLVNTKPVNIAPPNSLEGQQKKDCDISYKTIPEAHVYMGCSADNQMTNRMKYMGLQPKLAADIRAQHNVYKLMPYFDEELRDWEASEWWQDEADVLDEFL